MNTRSKRASSVGLLLSFVLAPPLADGTLDQGDRQHTAVSYSGILATASASVDATADVIIQVRADVGIISVRRDVGIIQVRPDVGDIEL
jgi:hypothetical protein